MTQTILKQYDEMKRKHPDAILLFRVGDFYECLNEDAQVASKILGITLTQRLHKGGEPQWFAGFPHHALDTYLPMLVRAGRRVAICEQLEDPKHTKKREATEIVTPNPTTLPNGLTIGSKVELKSMGFNNADGRFMIHNDKVGLFLSEPDNRWSFAPLILSPYDEERFRLYTELSWKYSEWIFVDEYDDENLPGYYDELVELYNRFVTKYGPLNAPENASFIRLDRYADNLDILEKMEVDEDGNVRYVPGDGFAEIKKRLPSSEHMYVTRFISSLLSSVEEISNTLHTFEEIRRHTRSIQAKASKLGISPKRAFEECYPIEYPTLF